MMRSKELETLKYNYNHKFLLQEKNKIMNHQMMIYLIKNFKMYLILQKIHKITKWMYLSFKKFKIHSTKIFFPPIIFRMRDLTNTMKI